MPRWSCLCYGKEGDGAGCRQCELTCPGNPRGFICPESDCEIDSGVRVDQDLGFSLSNRADVAFTAQTIQLVYAAATGAENLVDVQTGQPFVRSFLVCQICGAEIAVDADGKEVWLSESGNEHRTAPHIDHFNPDWAVRKARVERSKAYIGGDVQKQRQLLNAAYNEPGLRLTHRMCNMTKAPS